MKSKFEDNVASEIPKTRSSTEPDLPWKVSSDEIEALAPKDDEYRAAMTGTPPLKVRAIFLILLVVTIFIATWTILTDIAIENGKMQGDIMMKEKAASALKSDLEKSANEKAVLSENAAKLEKRVSDLSEQKEVYTAVIETLTKKTDETMSKDEAEPKE